MNNISIREARARFNTLYIQQSGSTTTNECPPEPCPIGSATAKRWPGTKIAGRVPSRRGKQDHPSHHLKYVRRYHHCSKRFGVIENRLRRTQQPLRLHRQGLRWPEEHSALNAPTAQWSTSSVAQRSTQPTYLYPSLPNARPQLDDQPYGYCYQLGRWNGWTCRWILNIFNAFSGTREGSQNPN